MQADLFMANPFSEGSACKPVKAKAAKGSTKPGKAIEKASKSSGGKSARPTTSPDVFPEKFIHKHGALRALAFGNQNKFNLLGHVANYVDQLPLHSTDRIVEMKNGVPQPITIDGRIIQSKSVFFDYKLTINPNARFARIVTITPSGKEKVEYRPVLHNFEDYEDIIYFRPGPREDLVEKALRRISMRQAGDSAGKPIYCARFSIYELRQELLRFGHHLRWSDIRDSLHILSHTTFTFSIMSENEQAPANRVSPAYNAYSKKGITSAYITSLVWGSRATNSPLYNPDQQYCYCTLNELIAHSLATERYQAFQYDIYMRMTSFIARKLFSILSLEWRNSNSKLPYKRSMNELLLRFQSHLNERLANDVRTMKRALDELIFYNVLQSYDFDKQNNGVGRHRTDFIITMTPTSGFVQTQIESVNDRTMRESRLELGLPTLQLSEDK